jgi:hypothetical protein
LDGKGGEKGIGSLITIRMITNKGIKSSLASAGEGMVNINRKIKELFVLTRQSLESASKQGRNYEEEKSPI